MWTDLVLRAGAKSVYRRSSKIASVAVIRRSSVPTSFKFLDEWSDLLATNARIDYSVVMFKVSKESLQGQDIICLGPYRPWSYHKANGGDGGDYPEHSGRVLDLKENKAVGVTYFFDYMRPKLKKPQAIAVVPSHDPAKAPGGLQSLAGKLANGCGMIDAAAALIRHTKITKLADGGDRSLNVHLNSIHVPDAQLIAGRKVLLIDDVMTSGNSLLACRQILLEAGAAEVLSLALGRTTY
jgi:hypothetical protein